MNWLHTLWFGYTYPSLQGNGPEALVQTIVYGLIALVFVPPIRKWFKREYDKVHAKIDKGHAELHAKLDGMVDSHSELHSKLDAIIKHHGISSDAGEQDSSVLGKGGGKG